MIGNALKRLGESGLFGHAVAPVLSCLSLRPTDGSSVVVVCDVVQGKFTSMRREIDVELETLREVGVPLLV